MASKAPKDRAVVVTTEFKGVFFGYTSELATVDTIRLARARNCVYWSSDVRGFMGLAVTGPTASCKIGPSVPAITLQKVTSVIELTPEAIAAWEKSPWTR